MSALFKNGAEWFRADFHLHTKADKEFSYSDHPDYYNSNYVDALVDAKIRIGAITNHNKFDFDEYKALRSATKKKDIFLLPGVELSVSEGSNGIHILIVFAETWVENNEDRINPFLSSMFPSKTSLELQNENHKTYKNILQTVEELQKIGQDYFLIFPHVEDAKGLWKEMGGGMLSNWQDDRYAEVRRHTLGFQKVRTHDERKKVKEWLGGWYPAEVEGSAPKRITEIGRGKACFLKLGAFTFEAVKFALCDSKNRLRLNEMPRYTHSHIRSISFKGGVLDGKTIPFSPELNTFIGIRGSGKSSILEALRYVLGLRLEEGDSDNLYKQRLVEWTLRSGGKIMLDALDRYGHSYQITRILRELPDIVFEGKSCPGISICETILHKPLFFGQKELAIAGKNSEKELLEKFIGIKCDEVRYKISDQKTLVTNLLDLLSKKQNISEQIKELVAAKKDTEHRLEFYKKHNLEEKLQKRLAFDYDIKNVEKGIRLLESFASDFRELFAKHEDDLANFLGYVSTENADFFEKFDRVFAETVESLKVVKIELAKTEDVIEKLKEKHSLFLDKRKNLNDAFATIERTLVEELKTTGEQNISSDEFLKLINKLQNINNKLGMLRKSQSEENELRNMINSELQKLKELWHEEFQIIQTELETITKKNTALNFCVEFKGDKEAFLEYFKNTFRGSGTRETTLSAIVDRYSDFCEIYNDMENAKKLFGNKPEEVANIFMQNLKSLLTYQTPNKFTITYHGTELAHHSLGQRASALILFVLGQQENDVIIIDQPEDDLDNQTLYEDVIKLFRKLKPKVQFICATHNPNIPVLGDAEQIHACSLEDGKIIVQSGALDKPEQQKKIVNIMEGGQEAFKRRKEIYQIWKS